MGLSNFPSAAEGVLPVLVMNTVVSVAVLKNIFKSVLQVVGASSSSSINNEDEEIIEQQEEENSTSRERRVSISQYKSLIGTRKSAMIECCCVCLCRFEANQEVSELPCKHFFHRGCLDKWFDNKHSTCPLCRSID